MPAMTANTIEGRLLCASGAAYSFPAMGPPTLALDPKNVYHVGAGFLQPPTVVDRGPDEIDACLVGEIPDGVIVAFHGTLPFDIHQVPTLQDWLNDLDAKPISAPSYFPGCVHSGFYNAFTNLYKDVENEVRARQGAAAPPGKPLFITGHSKGGAVAALMAYYLAQQPVAVAPAITVITFAAARPGDAAFAAGYAINHTRYEYKNDIVPHLPPSQDGFIDLLSGLPLIGSRFQGLRQFDYRSVGTLKYIDKSYRVHDDYPALKDPTKHCPGTRDCTVPLFPNRRRSRD